MVSLNKYIDLILLIVLFVVLNIYHYFNQEIISLNNGLGWDGIHYADLTEDFLKNQELNTEMPFTYRIGIPFLASLINEDIIFSWRLLGICANFISLLVLWYFLKFFISRYIIRILLFILFLFPFHSYIVLPYYHPVQLDSFDFLIIISSLLLIQMYKVYRKNFLIYILSLFMFAGVFIREFVVVIGFCFLFLNNPLKLVKGSKLIFYIKLPEKQFILPLLSGFLGIILIKNIVVRPNDHFFLEVAVAWFMTKTIPDYLVAVFIAYSPAVFLIIYFWREFLNFLKSNQTFLIYLLCVLIVSFIGGSATYRLLKWGSPLILVCIGIILEKNINFFLENKMFSAVLILSIIVSQRFLIPIPDYPGGVKTYFVFLTPLIKNADILDLIGMGNKYVKFLILISHIAVFAVLRLLIRNKLKLKIIHKFE